MPAPIKLPSGPLIHYWKFCHLIAEALQPINKNPTGIDCVWAKRYPSGVPSPYAGTDVPHTLDEADRRALAKVLLKLPPLKYSMSEKDINSFMEAYEKLPNRPMWMPVLVTKETMLGLKIKRDQIMDRHIAAIREERRAGRLVSVDANCVPLEGLEIGAHLTRKDAIAYLERHGLAYNDEEITKNPTQNALSSEAVHLALDADSLALSGGASPVGHPKLSAVQRAEVVKRSKELEAAGVTDFRARVAREYGVTPKSVYNWVQEDKKKKLSWGDLLPKTGK